jgi:hypothetical protein
MAHKPEEIMLHLPVMGGGDSIIWISHLTTKPVIRSQDSHMPQPKIG